MNHEIPTIPVQPAELEAMLERDAILSPAESSTDVPQDTAIAPPSTEDEHQEMPLWLVAAGILLLIGVPLTVMLLWR